MKRTTRQPSVARRWSRPLEPAGVQAGVLQDVQPALVGLIDGTISTLAPIFATAYIAGSRAALLVGLAAVAVLVGHA